MLTSSLRRSFGLGAAVVVLTIVAYSGTYGLSFASEDFILLGRLAQSSVFETLASEASGPWLGLEHVNFYRPVAMTLLTGETTLFGLSPFAFHLAHVLLHGVNALLVLWVVSLLTKGPGGMGSGATEGLPLAVAGLFALYPLHPSAVLFIGSFATLWGGTFQLVSLGCFLRFVLSGRKVFLIGAMAAFLLALGSYEAAVVLPGVMFTGGLALATPGISRGRDRREARRSLLGILPLVGLLVVYLLVRKAALGVVLGGYPSFRARWLEKLGQLALDLLASFPRLVLPEMERGPSRGLLVLITSVVLIVGALAWARQRTRQDLGSRGRWVLVGLIWAGLFQLPFSFVGVVPANGRFWYLPSFAIAFAVCVSFQRLLTRPALPRRAWFVPILALAMVYALLLRRDLGAYHAADRQVRGVQRAVLDQEAAHGSEAPWLIAGLPEFMPNGRGLPVAKVFQYGLHDAVLPPFSRGSTEVFPVPPFVVRDRLAPLAAAAGGRALVWDPESLRLRAPARFPQPEETIVADREGSALRFRCPDCASVRFFAVTRGGAFRGDAALASLGSLALPEAFLRGMGGLYGGPIFWWLEGKKAGQGERVVSEIHRLETKELFPRLTLRFPHHALPPRGTPR